MKRAAVLAAAARTALAVAGITRWTRRDPTRQAPADLAEPESPWGELPCPPLREGVGPLHDWLASGDWSDPTHVLEALRQQAPVRLVADLLRDLQTDLLANPYDGHHRTTAAQLGRAEALLLQAAEEIGEIDYNPPADPDTHPVDCPGGCYGAGWLLEVMTWDEGVPVHQEPVDCRRGEPEPVHERSCRCAGIGSYVDEDGYRQLCLGMDPGPDTDPSEAQLVPDQQDPWAQSAPPGWHPGDEPPF